LPTESEAIAALLAAERLPERYRDTIELALKPLCDLIVQRRAFFVGVSGPQGSGKTTAARGLRLLLEARGLRVASLSIDDLYLTRAERQALAARVHPLLATRGPPGTHDRQLGLATFDALRAGLSLALPRFDKAIDDRAPLADWPWFEGPADVVLFEGWCVGATPAPSADLVAPLNALERDEDPDGVWRAYVNDALAGDQVLFDQLDLLIQIVPPSFEVVVGWRREQEAKLRAERPGATGLMDDAQVARFVAHFERVTRRLLTEGPAHADAVLRLDAKRQPLSLSVQ
jgi:D-glycerate 3-kinase